MSGLRIGVPGHLLELPPHGGHGKVWSRVLDRLREQAKVVPLGGRMSRRPDVVLASGHAPLPTLRGVPLVAQVHEAGWFEPGIRELLDPVFLADIERHTERAVRTAAHVITLSHAVAADVARAYDVDRARVHGVHLGVDPVFSPGARTSISPAGPYVVHVGMTHPRKNLAAVRAAITDLAARGLPHRLVVVGAPPSDREDGSALVDAAREELPGAPGRVTYLEGLDDADLAGVMAGAEAICLPSLYEGFGLPVIEAMACGTPAVVSDRGALPEVVGQTGIVVEPDDHAALATALGGLLTDPDRAARLGSAARKRAAGFTWKRTADGWLEVLRAAAGDTRLAAP